MIAITRKQPMKVKGTQRDLRNSKRVIVSLSGVIVNPYVIYYEGKIPMMDSKIF
jgi:hypothetical protein